MGYFDDLQVVGAGIYPAFRGHIRRRVPQRFSLELVASGRMYFQREPEEQVLIDRPALRWQFPTHTYSYGSVDDQGWEHYYFLLEGERAARLYHEGFVPLVADGCVLPIHRVDLFRRLFITIHDHVMHAGLNPSLAAFHAEEVLVRAKEDLAQPRPFSRYATEFGQLCANLHANLGQEPDLPRLAAAMGLSYSRFRKLFTDYAGLPPHQYLLRARLTAAATRLRETDEPIKQIGYDLGLGNPSQFSKAFRQAYGQPPGTYRTAPATI